jgi:peptide/nickel transport system permease protein
MTNRRFFSRWQNVLGFVIVAVYFGIALAAPRLAPGSPRISVEITKANNFGNVPLPPSSALPLGSISTGILGEQLNVFNVVVNGTRSALVFGLTVALVTAAFGVLIGVTAAYLGGWVNNLIMRITDAFLAFPAIVGVVLFEQLLSIARQMSGSQIIVINGLVQQTGTPSPMQHFFERFDPVLVALILFSWMPYARIMNAVILYAKEADYVQAARALGAGGGRILFRHLIPNTISPAVVLLARDIGGMVVMQATLTFIGLGGQSTWGGLLATGRRWIIGPGGNPLTYWWVFVPATLALVFFGIGWNLLGDGLNDWLNPRVAEQIRI